MFGLSAVLYLGVVVGASGINDEVGGKVRVFFLVIVCVFLLVWYGA